MIPIAKKPLTGLAVILVFAFLLRAIALGVYPIGLYSDEASFGYNAYLLLKTGHDEYGRFWPMSFESFGDWKPPMQGWLAIPFIALLGLNEVAVRLPSAILGTATVAVVYFLAREFFETRNSKSNRFMISGLRFTPLLAAFMLAISPWHIYMSRTAMLVVPEVFFISLGVLSLLKGLRNNRWWFLSGGSFVGAIYSYYGSRVTIPLLLLSFVVLYWRKLLLSWRALIAPLFFATTLLLPLLFSIAANPLFLTGRAKTTSVFFNDNVRLQLWDAHTKAGLKHIPPIVSRSFDNKLYFYTRDVIGRYLSHFSPAFLFLEGDERFPFKIPHLGYLHLIELPFFLAGLYVLRKERQAFLLLYLLISPFVASLTFLTPAGNRSFNMVIPWTIISSYGLAATMVRMKHSRKMLVSVVAGCYLVSFAMYAYSYLRLIPIEIPNEWHYGRRPLIEMLKPMMGKYRNIYLTNNGGPPYIFLAFYLQISPDEFQKTVRRNPVINNLGWGHVDRILDITIPREFHWNEVPKEKDALYIGYETEIPAEDVNILSQVYYPNGRVAYRVATLK